MTIRTPDGLTDEQWSALQKRALHDVYVFNLCTMLTLPSERSTASVLADLVLAMSASLEQSKTTIERLAEALPSPLHVVPAEPLPVGWKTAGSATNGNQLYAHATGARVWEERPGFWSFEHAHGGGLAPSRAVAMHLAERAS